MAMHHGGCHCGAVRWQADTGVDKGLVCNCSICTKRGSILHFVPDTSFTLESGADRLTEYRFNKHAIAHLFCDTCGILSFARGTAPDGTKMVALNLRCVDGIDLKAIEVTEYDGASV